MKLARFLRQEQIKDSTWRSGLTRVRAALARHTQGSVVRRCESLNAPKSHPMQVLGSFSAFTIEWPQFVLEGLAKLKSLAQLNPIQINGMSCIFMSVDFERQLYM